jgi:hypothetical protein
VTLRVSSALSLAGTGALALTLHAAWNARHLRTAPPSRQIPPGAGTGPVALLLPARDEEDNIAACVESLLAQDYRALSIFILDDGSTDSTLARIRELAHGDPRVSILTESGEPPPGWLGKPWACQRLSHAALASIPSPQMLIFVDADVCLAPDATTRIVALQAQSGLDLISPYPRQLMLTPAERAIQPLLQWSWLSTLPLGLAERSPRPSLTAANGQLLAITSAAYRSTGGHRAVRDKVLEDLALARAVKTAGWRAAVTDGSDLATCRMYTGTKEIVDGYTKSLWEAFGSPGAAIATAAMLTFLYVAPPAAALLARDRRDRALGAGAYAIGVCGRVISARRTGGRPVDSWAHPLSILALDGLIALSLHRRARGTLRWKGRPILPAPGH